MSRLIVASALVLLAATGMAWGSKPAGTAVVGSKSDAATVQNARSGSLTRTMTGRPADLDPRIPWLDDLGMPQSGGPEPLVKAGGVRLPMIGGLQALAELGNCLAVVMRHRELLPPCFLWKRTEELGGAAL